MCVCVGIDAGAKVRQCTCGCGCACTCAYACACVCACTCIKRGISNAEKIKTGARLRSGGGGVMVHRMCAHSVPP